MAWNVVIAGGGFGGFFAARTLERALPAASARLTLVSDVNFLLYTPLLPGAAAGTLEPRHVVVPLREQLRRTELRLGAVVGGDPAARRLDVALPGGERGELRYDQLIVALGSVSRTPPVPGLMEHAIGFKSLADAIALRNRVISMLEAGEASHDSQSRAEHLTFVFVGAGYAGVEGLAELQDFMADVIDLYPRCKVQGMRWVLVEARARVMPEVAPHLAAFAERELRGRGIETLTGTTIAEVSDRAVRLSDGRSIGARTVVWTAGVRPHPVVARLGLPLSDGGRIEVDRTMRVSGHASVWAIGDAAAVPDPARRGQACPPTAQHAIRQGRRVARNVAAELGAGGRVRPFGYRTLGVFVDLGRHQAVASTMLVRWRGFAAWFLARTYHLANMPGHERKLRLLVDWTVALLFDRDTAELGGLERRPRLPDAPGEGGEDILEPPQGGLV
ncbi:MAG TPA: NAD(P)/FAD-dependent oxidoreductase [Solirubrobacteraceae bacterium]|nr:NAD(P)/FAD-dependent oxidoreductase [Solirubrobacteraceae bacterium]